MTEDVFQLRQLMEAYRYRSQAIPFRPVAEAYAKAADDLQEIIAANKGDATAGPTHAGR